MSICTDNILWSMYFKTFLSDYYSLPMPFLLPTSFLHRCLGNRDQAKEKFNGLTSLFYFLCSAAFCTVIESRCPAFSANEVKGKKIVIFDRQRMSYRPVVSIALRPLQKECRSSIILQSYCVCRHNLEKWECSFVVGVGRCLVLRYLRTLYHNIIMII
jgi:hypothetical protein